MRQYAPTNSQLNSKDQTDYKNADSIVIFIDTNGTFQ